MSEVLFSYTNNYTTLIDPVVNNVDYYRLVKTQKKLKQELKAHKRQAVNKCNQVASISFELLCVGYLLLIHIIYSSWIEWTCLVCTCKFCLQISLTKGWHEDSFCAKLHFIKLTSVDLRTAATCRQYVAHLAFEIQGIFAWMFQSFWAFMIYSG